MASFWLLLVLLYYMSKDTNAAPVRNLEEDYEVFGYIAEKTAQDAEAKHDRTKRAVLVQQQAGSGDAASPCDSGARYYEVIQKLCLIEDSVYNSELGLCLVLHCYVPGMSSGKKDLNYLVHKHYLYKYYNALDIKRKKKCPDNLTTVASTSTTQAIVSTAKTTAATSKTLSSTKSTSTSTSAGTVVANATTTTKSSLQVTLSQTTEPANSAVSATTTKLATSSTTQSPTLST